MSDSMGTVIIPGGDDFWTSTAQKIEIIKSCARLATQKETDRIKNLATMRVLAESINQQLEKNALIMYPITPLKCGFKGAVSSFHELIVCILSNPAGVALVEGW